MAGKRARFWEKIMGKVIWTVFILACIGVAGLSAQNLRIELDATASPDSPLAFVVSKYVGEDAHDGVVSIGGGRTIRVYGNLQVLRLNALDPEEIEQDKRNQLGFSSKTKLLSASDVNKFGKFGEGINSVKVTFPLDRRGEKVYMKDSRGNWLELKDDGGSISEDIALTKPNVRFSLTDKQGRESFFVTIEFKRWTEGDPGTGHGG